LQELPNVSQVSWETILGLSSLLLVRFGTLVNPVRRFWHRCLRLVFKTQGNLTISLQEIRNLLTKMSRRNNIRQ